MPRPPDSERNHNPFHRQSPLMRDSVAKNIYSSSSCSRKPRCAEKMHRYAVWPIPPDDVVRRIKKVMESLRAEFYGPQIDPHMTILGSILLSQERAVVLEKDG
ncbi:unnamed protein product [Prunus armeniaca]|uniref:RNA ligase/cyclic nucleotide phosphodiesterase family protein n=1 Tax=Prunus armeniaca TaxID=36596 RepID=A0A6J5XP42_PRUAR|nr:unnamed protein product [Prunus armeniaca]